MNFAHPPALLLLLLVVPVALLYWLRIRVPSRTVGTGTFWQKALAEEKARRRWRPWRTKVSLAVQVVLVFLIALAAAGPQVPASKRIVLILDNSATMRATDVQPTRMDAAKEVARRFVEGLRSCDEMAVVTVSPQPCEVQPTTSDRALLAAAVESVQATADPPAIPWAVRLAREILSPDQDPRQPEPVGISPRIVLLTDACCRDATKRAEQSGVEVLRVGTATGNVAITRLAARRCRAEPTGCEVLVEVRNQANHSAQGTLTLAIDEKPVRSGSVSFEVKQNDRWQYVFPLDLPASAARLTAQIEPGDAYSYDDKAVLEVPAPPDVHRATLTGEEQSYLKEILAANRRVDLISDDPQARAVHVIDGKRLEKLPAGPLLIFSPGIDIRVPGDIGSDAAALVLPKPSPPLWIIPAVLAAALLIAEWCLYQRRWTS